MISHDGIILADAANQDVQKGQPVYDAIRNAIERRELQIAVALEQARETYRPKTADDALSHAKIDAINLALGVVRGMLRT
jgi:hypothetical protein